jgi:DNA-binding GntR family transcriptional regulator
MKMRTGQIVHVQRLRDQVYNLIREELRSGTLGPGQRLVEVTLAERLGVSRTPVREALFQLARDGLLVESDRGYMLPRQTPEAIRERLELRLLLEPAVARRACKEATREQIEDLKRATEHQRRQVKAANHLKFVEANVRFRDVLLSTCRNSLLQKTARLYDDWFRWYQIVAFRKLENRQKVAAFHKSVCDAIAADRPALAEKAMREDLELALAELATLPRTGVERAQRRA